jgi:hypothetical protein
MGGKWLRMAPWKRKEEEGLNKNNPPIKRDGAKI